MVQVVKKSVAAPVAADAFSASVDRVMDAVSRLPLDADVVISIEPVDAAEVIAKKDISDLTATILARRLRCIVHKDAETAPEEERYVLGIVLEPLKDLGQKDLQADTYSADEVRKACYTFMQDFGNLGLQHQKYINGRVKILENWITRDDCVIEGQAVAKGTWLLGVRVVDDDLWASVKKGDITGFSIGGTAKRSPAKP